MDSLMTSSELSAYLKIRKSTVYKLTCSKAIPYIKFGGHLRFSMAQIDEWLAKASFRPLSN